MWRTVGTVEVGWSGLAAGDYLGAVSHSDGTSVYGYTLVEVDNTPWPTAFLMQGVTYA